MGKPYSTDLRERVVAAIKSGLSTVEAATRFSVGKATAGAAASKASGTVAPGRPERPRGRSMSTLRHQLKTVEKDMAKAEAARDRLQGQLAVAGSDHEALARIGNELATAQASLDTLEEQWLELSAELEGQGS